MSRSAEMAKHLRNRFKAESIKCKCSVVGSGEIRVSVPAYGLEFSDVQQRMIRHIAVCNRLTLVRGMPIDVDRMTDPHEFHFYMPS